MSSTAPAEGGFNARRGLIGLLAASGLTAAMAQVQPPTESTEKKEQMTNPSKPMSPAQLALGPVAAGTAVGDIARLPSALNRGLDAGLSIEAMKEAIVQLYAYAGFPRSLNGLTELMKVVDERRKRGAQDTQGALAGPVPVGAELLAVGTANQTSLAGAPVRGPLFEFAPAIDQFLKVHLFGDIFARDNLDWQSRELVTVAALAALSGVESQLLSHVRISLNVGITVEQLKQLGRELAVNGYPEAGDRLQAALVRQAAQATTN